MTSIGLIITGGLNLLKVVTKWFRKELKIKTHKNGCSLITEVGGNWGGLELGAAALCGNYSTWAPKSFKSTREHEFGHAIQHLYLGPLFIFVVAIPSATRYWLTEFKGRKNKNIFGICICLFLLLIAGLSSLLGIFINHWFYIMPALLIIYVVIYGIWLLCLEIPKYDKRAPKYDSIWFEGGATKTGAKFINWLEN
jgi:hypothetical protein